MARREVDRRKRQRHVITKKDEPWVHRGYSQPIKPDPTAPKAIKEAILGCQRKIEALCDQIRSLRAQQHAFRRACEPEEGEGLWAALDEDQDL